MEVEFKKDEYLDEMEKGLIELMKLKTAFVKMDYVELKNEFDKFDKKTYESYFPKGVSGSFNLIEKEKKYFEKYRASRISRIENSMLSLYRDIRDYKRRFKN